MIHPVMPNNPLESAISNNVKTDYAAGSVEINDSFTQTSCRVGIVDLSFLGALESALAPLFADRADHEFYMLGKNWGEEFYATLQRRIDATKPEMIAKPQDYLKEEFVEHLNSYFSYTGLGQFRITEGNQFYVIDLKNSMNRAFENAQFFSRVFAGFFAGLFSPIAGKELACIQLSESKEHYRFALSMNTVIEEIRNFAAQGLSEKDILSRYNNHHLV
jgi:hypothetical protein